MSDRLEVHAYGASVADVRCSQIADESVEANARLIAAAPELLAFVRKVSEACASDRGENLAERLTNTLLRLQLEATELILKTEDES